jgi:hypothetical protein
MEEVIVMSVSVGRFPFREEPGTPSRSYLEDLNLNGGEGSEKQHEATLSDASQKMLYSVDGPWSLYEISSFQYFEIASVTHVHLSEERCGESEALV